MLEMNEIDERVIMKPKIMIVLILFWFMVLMSTGSALPENSAFLNKIVCKESNKGAEIYLYMSGNYEFSGNLLDDPVRIVIDLKPVIKKTSSNIEWKGKYVKGARISQYHSVPEFITRVVVDLKDLSASTMDYSLVKEKSALLVKIELKSKEGNPAQQGIKSVPDKSTEPESRINKEVQHEPLPELYPPKSEPKITVYGEKKESEAKPEEDADYIIGPEDLLEVRIFELPALSNTVRVSSNGKISFAPLGDIDVNGLSKSQAEKRLSEMLQKNFINDAHAIIFIKEFKSQKVDIIGAVKKPGNYPMLGPKTILEMLSEAGGLSENSGKKLYVFRKNSSQTTKIEINLKDLLEQGRAELNIVVKPGDVINIPPVEKISVFVYGEVGNPGAIELEDSGSATILKAITKAGGPTDRANIRKVVVKRLGTKGKELTIKVNLKDVINGKTKDIILQDDDVIVVPESFF